MWPSDEFPSSAMTDIEKQTPSLEKGEVNHREYEESNHREYEEAAHGDIDHGFDPEFVKRTRRKIDWRVSRGAAIHGAAR